LWSFKGPCSFVSFRVSQVNVPVLKTRNKPSAFSACVQGGVMNRVRRFAPPIGRRRLPTGRATRVDVVLPRACAARQCSREHKRDPHRECGACGHGDACIRAHVSFLLVSLGSHRASARLFRERRSCVPSVCRRETAGGPPRFFLRPRPRNDARRWNRMDGCRVSECLQPPSQGVRGDCSQTDPAARVYARTCARARRGAQRRPSPPARPSYCAAPATSKRSGSSARP
jgi:hypothetical protein